MEWIVLSATGHLARVELTEPFWQARTNQPMSPRVDHDVLAAQASLSDGAVAAIASSGTAYRLTADGLPTLTPGGPWSCWDGPLAQTHLPLAAGERIIGLASLDVDAAPLALGTQAGVVKRVVPDYKGWDSWEVMALKDDDVIVGAASASDSDELVFISDDAQLLRLSAREVRPQGRSAGGMAGIKLSPDAQVIYFGAVAKADREQAVVVTLATGSDAASTVKSTGFTEYPAKGRATGGVRTQRFLKGQDHLTLAWSGLPPVRACDATGAPRNLPTGDDRRDGTGAKVYGAFAAFG